MSIDRLIVELDKGEHGDFEKIKSLGEKNLDDYIGVSNAYIDLLTSVKDHPQKTICISKIIQEIMGNIIGISSLVKHTKDEKVCRDSIESLAGQILKGEYAINELLDKFEELSDNS